MNISKELDKIITKNPKFFEDLVEIDKHCDDEILRKEVQRVKREAQRELLQEVFSKFDEYSCIKNDKWYLEYKEQKLKELKER